ncbi:MAG: TRAP transporter large permease [Betaproteobacteria bacterium]|nr:TRAP transporter large permease [Betaproteobacteria bacterium]
MNWVVFGLMLLLFFTGMPIVLAIGFCSLLYAMFVAGVPLSIIPQQVVTGIDTFLLLAIPMFILTGALMGEGDVTGKLVRFSQSLVGWMRGGLAQVNVLTNIIISGISGSGLADAAATGSALLPVMKKAGYGAAFSAAVTACGSTVGPIIPPSIIMVVIGGLTSISIGRMFLGGVVPGLILGFMFALVCYFVSRRRGYPVESRFSIAEVARSFLSALPSLGLPFIIIGGILSGAFTPTESAGIAAVYVIGLGLAYRKLSWRAFYRAVVETGVVTGTVMFVVGISGIFGWILISENVGDLIVEALKGLTDDPKVMMLLITAVLLVLGCFMEVLAILILSVPVLMPLVETIGIDPVYFGVIATVALATGLVTPPFGLTMFLMCNMAGVRIEEFAREAIPFLVCILVGLVLFIYFPPLVLWLPNVLMGEGK